MAPPPKRTRIQDEDDEESEPTSTNRSLKQPFSNNTPYTESVKTGAIAAIAQIKKEGHDADDSAQKIHEKLIAYLSGEPVKGLQPFATRHLPTLTSAPAMAKVKLHEHAQALNEDLTKSLKELISKHKEKFMFPFDEFFINEFMKMTSCPTETRISFQLLSELGLILHQAGERGRRIDQLSDSALDEAAKLALEAVSCLEESSARKCRKVNLFNDTEMVSCTSMMTQSCASSVGTRRSARGPANNAGSNEDATARAIADGHQLGNAAQPDKGENHTPAAGSGTGATSTDTEPHGSQSANTTPTHIPAVGSIDRTYWARCKVLDARCNLLEAQITAMSAIPSEAGEEVTGNQTL